MAVTTVRQDRQNTSTGRTKGKSGLRDRWRRTARHAVRPEIGVEHSTFPDPDLPTQAIPVLRPSRPAVGASATVHGTHPAHLLFAVVHRAMDVCADPKADHRAAYDALAPLMQSLLEGAKGEANFDRRTRDNKAAAEAQAATLEDAAKRGHGIGPDSPHGRQVVADIVDRARRAPAPESTALLAALTPDVLERLDAGVPVEVVEQAQVLPKVETVPAVALPSPVHIPGDGVSPAVPAGDDADSDDTLPHRPQVTVMPAPMTSGEHPEPIGLRNARPAYGEVFSGDWVFDDSGPDGAGVLKLVERVQVSLNGSGDPAAARVFFADGTSRRVKEDRTVRALQAVEAAPLLEKYKAQLAEFEALPLGGAL